MRAAVLSEYGAPPAPGDFPEPPAPAAGQAAVDVVLAGLNPVDRHIASGRFYAGSPPLPYVPGREGVVRRPDGSLAYFDVPIPPYGGLAPRTLVREDSLIPLPEGLDPGLAIAFGVAGLAGWLGLSWRADLRPGERVLVLGASGVVGMIAVQAARLLGAGEVVAAARDADGLARARDRGADATVRLGAEGWEEALQAAAGDGYDVIVDPLWGEPAAAALQAIAAGGRLVQIGAAAAAEATLPSAAIRGKLASVLGHTNFHTPPEVKREAYLAMAAAGARGDLVVDVERVPLDAIADAWERLASGAHGKLVVEP
jgi:NADPH:quinone reductase-like Zn-dependent oxidoreductase